jgi:hypothetical protein
MNEIAQPTQDERLVAALAHANVILGLLNSGGERCEPTESALSGASSLSLW